jgi:hypothetical protein
LVPKGRQILNGQPGMPQMHDFVVGIIDVNTLVIRTTVLNHTQHIRYRIASGDAVNETYYSTHRTSL